MNQVLRTAFYKHGFLLIAAAWLYTISFIVVNYWAYSSSPEKVKDRLQARITKYEERAAELNSDNKLLSNLLQDSAAKDPSLFKELPFGFFVHTATNEESIALAYWSSNQYYINPDDLLLADGNYFVDYQNGSFELMRKSLEIGRKKIITTALIPIQWKYFTENKYLHTSFEGFPGLKEQYELSHELEALPILSSEGKQLFKIKLKRGQSFVRYDWFTILLRVIAVFLLMIFLNATALEVAEKKGFLPSVGFLLPVIFILRFITYQVPFPFQFSRLYLFDPSIYASNMVHPSLGDLLINVVLVFWVVSYCKYVSFKQNYKYFFIHHPILKFIYLVCFVAASFIAASIIRSLVQDSKISFDVTNFFSLNFYSIISFAILCLIALCFYHLSHFLLKPLLDTATPIANQVLVITATGLLYLTFTIGRANTVSNLLVVAWLIVYVWLLNKRKQDIYLPILRSSFFIFWVMLLAVSVTLLVSYQNKAVEWEQRKKMAERLSTQGDPGVENLLGIALNFDSVALVKNFPRLYDEYANKFIKDSLLNENFSGYLNKFEARLYTFDSLYNPLYNDDSTTFATLETIINNKGKRAENGNLYRFQNSNNKINYLYKKEVVSPPFLHGYLFVVVEEKRFKIEALFPELFKQQELTTELNPAYGYAEYSNGKIVRRSNDYDFPLQIKSNFTGSYEYKEIKNNGYTELWYNPGNNKEVVITKEDTKFIEVATLFAYLFFTFLLVVCLFHVGNYLLQTRFKKQHLQQLFRFNIRSQIHGTIIFISVFSFIIIGFATISFFIMRFSKANEERLSRSIQLMANEVEAKISALEQKTLLDDFLTVHDEGYSKELNKTITEISEVHNVDVNYFNTNGKLVLTTQPYIYNKFLLSDKMQPQAYQQLHYNKRSRVIQNEKIGSLQYVSIYVPIMDDQGKTYAYLNIPYLGSQAELNQEISNFIATLINLNAFVFLLAGAIAFLLTERIVSSFKVIGDKMQEVNLGKQNEAIAWDKNDEIAALVNEYNKMVRKLEQSAVALAASEREGAWREMARQVAHEIKNPLTPMKLSIQYLQRAIDNDAPNTKELSQKVANTLVEQIDQLSKIAGDFSQFANISNVNAERFDITDVLASIINLYKHDERVNISLHKQEGTYKVEADRTQMNRVFTNLIKNGIEAAGEGKLAEINVYQYLKNNHIIIKIADNGTGIPAEMTDKIFTPNFTTKTSGTGLGLAICKGIVENAHGTIHFVTEENTGTTFIVELPLAV